MNGWLRVEADAVTTKLRLQPWVDDGVELSRSLPKKKKKKKKK